MIKKILLLAVLCLPSLGMAEGHQIELTLEEAYQNAMQQCTSLKEEKARLEATAGEAQQASA